MQLAKLVNVSLLCLCHSIESMNALCFWFCPLVLFVRTDLVTTISHERLEQPRLSSQKIFTSPYG